MLTHIYRIYPTIQSTEINISQVVKDLENVKAKKASGPDGISSRALSLIKSSAADGLFTVFHKSSCLNQFPDIWKHAKITPVHKKGSFSEVSAFLESFLKIKFVLLLTLIYKTVVSINGALEKDFLQRSYFLL